MKKFFLLCTLGVCLMSCKNDAKKATDEAETKTDTVTAVKKGIDASQLKSDQRLLRGEFIYVADAAVLKGDSFIYGVELDSMATVLANQVEKYKREAFDMVPVLVQAKVKPNPAKEGWDEVIEIKRIIKVMEPKGETAVKVKGKSK